MRLDMVHTATTSLHPVGMDYGLENAKVMYSMSLSLGGCRALARGEQAWSELDNRIM